MPSQRATPRSRAGAADSTVRDRRGDHGLLSLEWLVLVTAFVVVGASSAMLVEQLVAARTDVPPDPVARLMEADAEAARLEIEAASVERLYSKRVREAKDKADANGTDPDLPGKGPFKDRRKELKNRCEVVIPEQFADVVEAGNWTELAAGQRATCTLVLREVDP